MAQAPARAAFAVRLLDAHCHLKDPPRRGCRPLPRTRCHRLRRRPLRGQRHLRERLAPGEADGQGASGRRPLLWFPPMVGTGEVAGLDGFAPAVLRGDPRGGCRGDRSGQGFAWKKNIDFGEQVEVFQRQLELAKELKKPVSVHCVRAVGGLLEILKRTGPFPAAVLLHSYLGSAEMVPSLANLGCYFSLSGFLTGMKFTKAKQMLKLIPSDRILLETDAPDALPKLDDVSVLTVPLDSSDADIEKQHKDSNSQAATTSNESLNHPTNIHIITC